MHFEVLVEDASGKITLESVLEKILGPNGEKHSFKIHAYKGIGQVLRTLVIAPKGLVTQWVAEMQTHFKEEFRLIIPSDIAVYKKFSGKENIWQSYHQIICPIDSIKPLANRKGWSDEQVAEYNRERFEDLISAGWDLIIVDEAHRLGGSTDQVARYKLGQGLSEAAPYFLLLSATPHQGKTEAFHRLVALLDRQNFPDVSSEQTRENVSIFESEEDLDPSYAQQLLTHPLPHWVERMTVSYLKSKNGRAEKKGRFWNLLWSDGTTLKDVAFTIKDAEEKPTSYHLTLEDSKIRGLAMRLPRFVHGQPVPIINIESLSNDFKGLWSIWKISIYTEDWNRSRILPIFMTDSDKIFLPTARHIWDQLLTEDPKIYGYLDNETSRKSYDRLNQAVEKHGETIYNELVQMHRKRMIRDREKNEYAFSARRHAIERIGLPQVRAYRYARLEEEERQFKERFKRLEQVIPEIAPIQITMVSGGNDE